MTGPDDQTEALFRSRPDLENVQLELEDGEIDAGLLLDDLRHRMTSVIDDWAHGFEVSDYLPWSDVEALIRGGAGTALVSAAARYGAELIHTRYGSSEQARQPPPESFDLTDYIDNLTPAGMAAGTEVFSGYLTRRDDAELIFPDEFAIPADAVSAYTTAVALFSVTVTELERELLAGAPIPQPGEAASPGWIAQQVYALVARRLHRVRDTAPEVLASWITEFGTRDYVETAFAVIDWSRQQTDTALESTDALLMMRRGPDLDRELAAARHIASALQAQLRELYDRAGRAVGAESFRRECTSQDEAVGWTWQLISAGLLEILDSSRRAICAAWVSGER